MSSDSSVDLGGSHPDRDLAGAFLALVRPRMLPSAAADVLAGAALGGGLAGVAPFSLLAAMLSGMLLYAGALVWNDVCGIEEDGKHRPERPLPRGACTRAEAGLFGSVLLLLGILVHPSILLAGGILVAALAYDLLARRSPWTAALPAFCRLLLCLSGISVLDSPDLSFGVLSCLGAYAGYVVICVLHGRLEDRGMEAGGSPLGSSSLKKAALVTVLIPGLFGKGWSWLGILPLGFLLVRDFRETADPAARTGALLRGLLRFPLILALAGGSLLASALLLIPGYAASWLFGKRGWS